MGKSREIYYYLFNLYCFLWGYWFNQNFKLDAVCLSPKNYSSSAILPYDIDHKVWKFFNEIKIAFRNYFIWGFMSCKKCNWSSHIHLENRKLAAFKRKDLFSINLHIRINIAIFKFHCWSQYVDRWHFKELEGISFYIMQLHRKSRALLWVNIRYCQF